MQVTKREKQVLQHLADGKLQKQVAADLFISERTVENHVQNIRRRNGVHTLAGMVAQALREGLVQ